MEHRSLEETADEEVLLCGKLLLVLSSLQKSAALKLTPFKVCMIKKIPRSTAAATQCIATCTLYMCCS